MRNTLLQLAGMTDPTATANSHHARFVIGILRGFWPLVAPFAILLCEPRKELASAAACWSLMMIPGLLATNLLFGNGHLLGRGLGKLSTASMLSLLPFGLVCWVSCYVHASLSAALVVYAILFTTIVVFLGVRLVSHGPLDNREKKTNTDESSLHRLSRPVASTVFLCLLITLAGICIATHNTQEPHETPGLYDSHGYWLHGTLVAAAGSIAVAVILVLAKKDSTTTIDKSQNQPATKSRGSVKRNVNSSWPVMIIWLGVGILAWHTMSAAYRMPPAPEDRPRHMYRPAWNSDDVAYVSEAVDCRYDLPMGLYESSLGSDIRMSRSSLSPLTAPLVAAISRLTGTGAAALHHSVLPPLIVLVGISTIVATLNVVFRSHRWIVPVGTLVVLMLANKSWEYERSMTEFTIWRAMQTKSIHLWLIHPLQLGTLIVILGKPNKRNTMAGAAVAIVGHLIHPFATILGTVWSGAAGGLAALQNRKAIPSLLVVVACYGTMGGIYYAWSHGPSTEERVSSGRTAGEAEQTRDLVRIDEKAVARQDPQILFGWNVVFCLGAVASPMILAAGRYRRELVLVGVLGLVGLACCNVTILGELLGKALPMSILWRARWIVPALIGVAAVSSLLYTSIASIMTGSKGTASPAVSFFSCLLTAGVFVAVLGCTSAYATKLGPLPKQLSKFSDDMHELVNLLGGVEAAPYVWGPRDVTRELPQLMPNVKLVLSRRKLMRPADDPDFRKVVLYARTAFYTPGSRFRGGKAPADSQLSGLFNKLMNLYPFDHVVVDYKAGRGDQIARILSDSGWSRVGRAGQYEVWRINGTDEK